MKLLGANLGWQNLSRATAIAVGVALAAAHAANPVEAADTKPLQKAHAHNDYNHPRPLLDALSHGFCSVEADVFVAGEQLLIAHDAEDVRGDRTLRKLYLDPLKARTAKFDGQVYPNSNQKLILLIDFKSEAADTFPVLMKILEDYRSMLERDENGKRISGAVQVIVSGNRPIEAIQAQSNRLAFIDGRADDRFRKDADWIPLISESFESHFKWDGTGKMPNDEFTRLREFVRECHDHNKVVRFWAIPDQPTSWATMQAAGVDFINTDNLAGLAKFLRQPRTAKPTTN